MLRPGGVLAFWCYHHCTVDAACDAIIGAIFDEVEEYWPPERVIVENRYADIDMPFDEIVVPESTMSLQWQVGQILAYMQTWSASQRCLAATGRDPVAAHAADLTSAWGSGQRMVRWPLILRVGRQ